MPESAMFSAYLLASAGALALWAHARFPRLEPAGWRTVAVHVVSGMLAINLLVPAAMEAVVAHRTAATVLAAAVGVALPGMTYALLTCVWMLRVAQRMLGGAR